MFRTFVNRFPRVARGIPLIGTTTTLAVTSALMAHHYQTVAKVHTKAAETPAPAPAPAPPSPPAPTFTLTSNPVTARTIAELATRYPETEYTKHPPTAVDELGTQTVDGRLVFGVSEAEGSQRRRMESFVLNMQAILCQQVEQVDGDASFVTDLHVRPDGLGGGITRVLQMGRVFEKAGINTSVTHGTRPAKTFASDPSSTMSRVIKQQNISPEAPLPFFAASISLVLHPYSPLCPSVHANYRYFESTLPNGQIVWWFGGGSDLSPTTINLDDGRHFHGVIRDAANRTSSHIYPQFKLNADVYFYIPHRQECRGIGGIFFDYQDGVGGTTAGMSRDQLFQFVKTQGHHFAQSYLPLVEAHKNEPYTEEQIRFKELRRGRYAEFNLKIDRGTIFGLNIPNPRTESILMSLPLHARWEFKPQLNAQEQHTQQILKNPIEWVNTNQKRDTA